MNRTLTSVIIPPMGAYRYGCGTSCAAPISVFWLAGVVAIIYSLFGGPAGADGVDFYTLALGVVMWFIASIWTLLTMSGVAEDRCSPLNSKVSPTVDETDPMDEVRRAKQG
ncbi:hypothetical protein [Solemya elarraichensis gill symbiont]|uniref:Uncharacterized protein n=1 Tax=Solemya elarraichensis gill symbiont TaxID=1918949 RepID=A0A1T2L6J7_9GAMM|nr:hypothetical protein [Solemya elarraichensis gill symbiont]OOZ40729.1 hypothetical protein BOW52_05460 [Solemya elarraichensis gill symbiont]